MDYKTNHIEYNQPKTIDINYAELYGMKPNESDFNYVINRSLEKGVTHLSENFIRLVLIRHKDYETIH